MWHSFVQPTIRSSLGVYDSCSTLTIIFPIATLLTWDYVPDCLHLSVLKAKNMWAGALERGYEYPWQLLQKIWGSFVFVIRCTIACDPIHMTWQAGLIMHSLCWIPYLCSWWVNVAISIKFQFQGGGVMVWNDVLCNSEGATVLYHVISTHRLWNVAIIVEAELLNYFGWSAQVQEAKMASHLAGLGCKDCEQRDQT